MNAILRFFKWILTPERHHNLSKPLPAPTVLPTVPPAMMTGGVLLPNGYRVPPRPPMLSAPDDTDTSTVVNFGAWNEKNGLQCAHDFALWAGQTGTSLRMEHHEKGGRKFVIYHTDTASEMVMFRLQWSEIINEMRPERRIGTPKRPPGTVSGGPRYLKK